MISVSCGVLYLLSDRRSAPCAVSRLLPTARRTWLGSREPDEQAEPDEAQPTAHTMANGKDHFAAEALRWLGGSVRVETVLG